MGIGVKGPTGEPRGNETWSENDSETFIDLGPYAVPEREEQIETVCALLPLAEGGLALELCCGAGLLTRAMLERYPKARVRALDGSQRMLEEARRAAGDQAGRLDCGLFDLTSDDWRHAETPYQAVVSSLAIHHLDGPGKQALYRDVAGLLAPGGAFVVADLIEPVSRTGWALAAAAWDRETRRRSLEIDGSLAAFERFQEEHWNHYSAPEPDPVDQPSPLLDQLLWLREAGLTEVDVHWMKAGHAIFGGRKPA